MTEKWRGIFKLTEESGELLQLLGKLGPFPHCEHPDGSNLRPKLMEELADLTAAIKYFQEMNFSHSEIQSVNDRAEFKFKKFVQWGLTGVQQ